MYDNNFSDVNSTNTENKENSVEKKPADGIFSSQASTDINDNVYGSSNTMGSASYGSNSNVRGSAYGTGSNTAGSTASYGSSSYTAGTSYGTDGNITRNTSYSSNNGSAGASYGANGNMTGSASSYSANARTTGTSYGANVNTAGGSSYSSAGYAQGTAYGSNSNTAGSNTTSSSYAANTTADNNSSNAYGYGAGTWNNSNYNQSGEHYQYSSPYSADTSNIKKAKKKKEKKKREKTGNGYFKKVLVCVSLGLFFGVCAGLGLYAVESATGMLDNNTAVTQTNNGYAAGESADAGNDGSKEAVSDSVSYDINGSDIQKTQTITTVVSDVSDVVEAVMPAVVSISNTYIERVSYFGQTMTSEAQASGSGIIVGKNDTELLIATNYHVIEDADTLKVQFVENSEVEAFVKGMDADMDLAVISVSLDSIQDSTLEEIAIATLGDSDALTVGEPAIAIGNSLGYGQSVTTGVISALNRDMELSDGSTGTFIQTDAAINPGNSGGALLNIRGEVIGINSNKIGGSVVEGMGYAIPISAASPIIAELMLKETKNKVAEDERGFLGISGISVTSEVSSAYGMPEGVYIAQVYDNTAAAAAGLVKGDIITTFDGESVTSMEELQSLLEYYAKGDTVEMTVMTVGNGGYHSRTVNITLGNKVD